MQCNSLPRPADSNSLLIVQLERNAEYRSHVLSESVGPLLVQSFLKFLKHHNHLYSDTKKHGKFSIKCVRF